MDRQPSRDSRGVSSSSTTTPGISAQIRDAKGLALQLKTILKRKDPWDRDVEFQRESLRKAYLRIVFSPALASSTSTSTSTSSTSALHRTSTIDVLAPSTSLRARSLTATPAGPSTSSSKQQLDILNLLWLDTSHALIQSYRARLAALDKQLAAAPKAHKARKGAGAAGGDVQPAPAAPVGPVARRKLAHAFRAFLAREEDVWRTLCGRLVAQLGPLGADELEGLRGVGIVPSGALAADDVGRGAGAGREAGAGEEEEEGGGERDLSDEERRARRAAVLPLAHKALVCFGDLARYAELYSDAGAAGPAPAAGGAGPGRKGGRGGRGGKGGAAAQAVAAAERRSKSYVKAAECYNQARLLLPDNGNPSNQLAVLAQYSSDPLSSIYHYYRALTVRHPFSTARANLQITFAKALARWFPGDGAGGGGGEPEGDEGDRFKAAFVVLQGILFTKDRLSDRPSLSNRLQDLFQTVLTDRLFTSDVVSKVVVTALSALWDARMSRSAGQGSTTSTLALGRSKTGSTAAAATGTPAPEAAASAASRVNLEPEALAHLVSLFTLLLRTSTTETIDLFSSNAASSSSSSSCNHHPIPNPAQNISAVLRRALPALRILTKWLCAPGQLDYVGRVEARVEAAERRRAARARARTTSAGAGGGGAAGGSGGGGWSSNEAQAQLPLSLESSTASRGSGSGPDAATTDGRVSLVELRTALDALWSALADYANAVKLAFPRAALPPSVVALLDDGGWLDEDVELLGFAPLRRALRGAGGGGGGAGEDASGAGIRRVGRDVHPNEEQLMRVAEGQRDARVLAESPLTPISLVDGAFVFTPRGDRDEEDVSFEAAPAVAMDIAQDDEEEEDEDEEMVDQGTEDDPVDRAMRIDAADKLDMDGLSDLDDDAAAEDEDDDDDDDDESEEQIVYPPSRSSSQTPAQLPPLGVSRSPSYFGTPSASPSRAPTDLRQQLLHGGAAHPAPATGAAPRLSPSSSHMGALPSVSGAGGPSLLVPAVGSSPSLNPVHSIWTPTPGLAGSPLLPSSGGGGTLPPPSAYALPQQQQQQQQQPVTPRSFESIPNLTHGSPAAHLAGWPSAASSPHGHGALPPPAFAPGGGAGGAAAVLYGGAFAAPLPQGAPFPYHPAAARGTAPQQQQQQRGGPAAPPGLSPFALPFGQQAPASQGQGQGQGGGWPSGYS